MKIKILSRELVKPSSPTPLALKDFKLSFIDERIPHFFIPLILYYTYNESSGIKPSEMDTWLKASMAEALTDFYPLAGRMKGQTLVDCNDEGVYFLVSVVDGMLQELIEYPKNEVLDNLIPYKSHGSTLITNEQLAVQVNMFQCGGIAIGFCLSHRIADGSSLWTFIKAWAAKAAGQRKVVSPVFNCASLLPARGTPDFRPNPKCAPVLPSVERLVTKRFYFPASFVGELKNRVIKSSSIMQPSRVEVVFAMIWKCWMVAKGLDKDALSATCVPVNLRGKDVILDENSFGNLFQMATTLASGETDWIVLVEKLRKTINKFDNNYITRLLAKDGFEIHKKNFTQMRDLISQDIVKVLKCSPWCNFPLYEVDFGWGKPSWVTSAGFASKDTILMFNSKDSRGVEAWVVMADHEMGKLEQEIELKVYYL
ncbi:hypothetical protein LIER_28011 [Lithospermum erythrorhizon]|uniref:Uncharacterized protein n=1 Tax=Lithospermum erythrorhizon TaxID=34254 RepID=A0AAV3RHK8_LITER